MRKLFDILRTLLIFGVIAAAIVWMSGDLEKKYVARAYVIDGDTVIINGEKIRLEGIDAPELSQVCSAKGKDYRCGIQSRNYLRDLARKGEMVCKAWQRDKYERLLGQCFVGGGDINGEMVEAGWAVSFGGYYRQESLAKLKSLGLWKGKFERPVDWRHTRGSVIEISHNMSKGRWWKFW